MITKDDMRQQRHATQQDWIAAAAAGQGADEEEARIVRDNPGKAPPRDDPSHWQFLINNMPF